MQAVQDNARRHMGTWHFRVADNIGGNEEKRWSKLSKASWRKGILGSCLEGTQKVRVLVTVAVCVGSISYGTLYWVHSHRTWDNGRPPHLVTHTSNRKAQSAFLLVRFGPVFHFC